MRRILPLILWNCEKILQTGNITTYQQNLLPERHSINSKTHCCKKEIERNFLRRNTFFYYP